MHASYFITFTTYGTWLHGDPRGSADSVHNMVGSERVEPSEPKRRARAEAMPEPAFLIDAQARETVSDAIAKLADHRGWKIEALYVGSNHVHVVMLAPTHTPAIVASQCKSWATRALKDAGQLNGRTRVWTKMASTRYLNADESKSAAIDYVRRFQHGERRSFG